MTPWERYDLQNPKPPVNHEYDYLQAKSSGYSNGSQLSTIGASHHKNALAGNMGGRGSKKGSLFGFAFIVGTAALVFQYLYHQPDDLKVSLVSAGVAGTIACGIYANPQVKKFVDGIGWIALVIIVLSFLSKNA